MNHQWHGHNPYFCVCVFLSPKYLQMCFWAIWYHDSFWISLFFNLRVKQNKVTNSLSLQCRDVKIYISGACVCKEVCACTHTHSHGQTVSGCCGWLLRPAFQKLPVTDKMCTTLYKSCRIEAVTASREWTASQYRELWKIQSRNDEPCHSRSTSEQIKQGGNRWDMGAKAAIKRQNIFWLQRG